MDGRYPNGMLLVFSNCGEAGREDEFNRWYNHMHLPDVTATGVFGNPMRLENADRKDGQPGYIALYETAWDDAMDAWKAQNESPKRVRSPERMSPLLDVVHVGIYQRLGGELRAANRKSTGGFVVMANVPDPARTDDFNRFYTDIHVRDILESGLYHIAYRYECREEVTGKGARFLNLYETDQPDPAKAFRELLQLNTGWKEEGRFSNDFESAYAFPFKRLYPKS